MKHSKKHNISKYTIGGWLPFWGPALSIRMVLSV